PRARCALPPHARVAGRCGEDGEAQRPGRPADRRRRAADGDRDERVHCGATASEGVEATKTRRHEEHFGFVVFVPSWRIQGDRMMRRTLMFLILLALAAVPAGAQPAQTAQAGQTVETEPLQCWW